MLTNVYYPKPSDESTYGTNPEYPSLNQCVTLSVGAAQINKFIRIPRRIITSASPTAVDDAAFERTLAYLYDKMRTGIYVLIKRGRVAMFAPFVNPDFRNTWRIIPPAVLECGVEPDTTKWWANANILCNIAPKDYVGDHGWKQHLRFLTNVCANYAVQDIEFFLNKRDSPQLRVDRLPVFKCAYDPAGPPLQPESEGRMLPIMSPYVSEAYADVAWPLMNDFAYLDGPAYIPNWETRKPSAVFRGSSTGSLTDNVRVDLCKLMYTDCERSLDARLTSWNSRDRLDDTGHVVKQAKDLAAPCSPTFHLRWDQQMRDFRYAVYVQGHVAASRYMEMMLHCFVILKVATRGGEDVADKVWFSEHLQPMVDYVPVKADLSDLFERIQWLRHNDAEAHKIAKAAHALGTSLRVGHHAYAAIALNKCSASAAVVTPPHWLSSLVGDGEGAAGGPGADVPA